MKTRPSVFVQILAGLITYLLLAIYCHQKFDEKVSIKRVRQLRILIQNQLRCTGSEYQNYLDLKNKPKLSTHAKS